MKTYTFIDWSNGDGAHVSLMQLADDQEALAHLATYGPHHTCEEVLPAGSRCVTS